LVHSRSSGVDVATYLGTALMKEAKRLDLAAWPELSPFVVTAAAENDRVLGFNEIGAAGIRFVVPSGEEPVGSLSHSIERQEVTGDYLARGLGGLLLDGVGVGLERHGGTPSEDVGSG
jgi:hypothetical protein